MIERYTRREMGEVWTTRRRMEGWLEVELAATDAWAAEGVVPAEEAKECRARASFAVEDVEERERTTGHDVPKDRLTAAQNLFQFGEGERLVAIVDARVHEEHENLVFVTANGGVKRCA